MTPTDWARDAVAELLRQTAVKLSARRERERVEAELWLTRLRREAAERREREGRNGGSR